MRISYNFECTWTLAKKECISRLLSERIFLLTGANLYNRIDSINIIGQENKQQLVSCHVITLSNEDKETYVIEINKDILIAMLNPGIGQLNFDNLILDIKDVLASHV